MKQTLNKDQFRFQMNQIRPDNFSYEGQGVLFDYLEQLEDDLGEQIEFDPIAFCCDYTESHYTDIIGDYETEITDHFGAIVATPKADLIEYVRNWLNNHTFLIGEPTEGVFLFQQF